MNIFLKFWPAPQDTYPDFCLAVQFLWFVCFPYSIYGISLNNPSENLNVCIWYQFTRKIPRLLTKACLTFVVKYCWMKLPACETQKIIELKWVLDSITRNVIIIPRQAFGAITYFFLPHEVPPFTVFITIFQKSTK